MEILCGVALCLMFVANIFLSAALSSSEDENKELKAKLYVVEQLLKIEKRDK